MDEFSEFSGKDETSPMLNERGSASKKQKTDESNSFDLDNSDQLNDIISKYENMLGDEKGESAKVNGRISG